MTSNRIALTAVISLLVALLGCKTTQPIPEAQMPLDKLWKPLMQECPCPTPEFRNVLHKVVDQWDFAFKCHVERAECRNLGEVDKKELQYKVNHLEAKLSDWWRLPIVWCAVGMLAGFGLGAGIVGVVD